MNSKDALKYLEEWEEEKIKSGTYKDVDREMKEAIGMARIALRKGIPKKFTSKHGYDKRCPCCDELLDYMNTRYCFNCGQRVSD